MCCGNVNSPHKAAHINTDTDTHANMMRQCRNDGEKTAWKMMMMINLIYIVQTND